MSQSNVLKPILLVGLAGGAAWFLYKAVKASALNSLHFIISKVKPGWQGLTPTLEVTINVGNPSPQKFTVNALVGDFYVNNLTAGSVETFARVVVEPSTQVPLVLTVRLSIVSVAKQIVDIVNGAAPVAANIRFVGKVNIDDILFPVDVNYSIV